MWTPKVYTTKKKKKVCPYALRDVQDTSYNVFSFYIFTQSVIYSTTILPWNPFQISRAYDKHLNNILLLLIIADLKWTLIRATGCIPGARDGHSACVIGNRMYVFGGFEEQADRFSNDVYALDLWTFKWEYVCTQGVPPSHRDFHSACAIYNRMYIFGGRGDMDNPYHSSRDTYCNRLTYLDTETSRWHFARALGDVPTGRRSHSSFVYRGEMYIFGGYDSVKKKHYGTMHCYDPGKLFCAEHSVKLGYTMTVCLTYWVYVHTLFKVLTESHFLKKTNELEWWRKLHFRNLSKGQLLFNVLPDKLRDLVHQRIMLLIKCNGFWIIWKTSVGQPGWLIWNTR